MLLQLYIVYLQDLISLLDVSATFILTACHEAPRPYQWEFQIPASWQMLGIIDLYFDIMSILIAVAVFVLLFMYSSAAWAAGVTDRFFSFLQNAITFGGSPITAKNSYDLPLMYRDIANRVGLWRPHTYFSHWAVLEFLWTIVPCLILVFIAIPSFSLVLALDQGFKPVFWVKVIGNQWFWTYECSTYSTSPSLVVFESVMSPLSDVSDRYLRLLSVDNLLTIPCLKPVRFLVTSNDVIHSWAVPSLGLKIDAVPGRINMANVFCMRTGIYYGQCSEICGVNHAFMPIMLSVVISK